MTSTETHVRRHAEPTPSDGALYSQRVARLRYALDVAGDRLDPKIAEHARTVLAGADERLALGVDHTIVALAGGTGSGKSSTFNALSRLTFADVGVRRPTTAKVTACSWSEDTTALLDWLEVEEGRRITRGSALDGPEEATLDGLILLDLPDHDSIEPAHREIVDRILPLVDLLIWVVDPQKYADEALHAGYLKSFVGAEASMIVVLNQIDTIAASGREALVADVAKLLRADGLVGVDVRTISARTGEGVDALRETLRAAVAQRSVAARRLADELDREGRRVAAEVPADVLRTVHPLIDGEVDRIAIAVGVEAVVDDVRATILRGGSDQPPMFRAPQDSAIRVVRSRWLARVTEGMRPAWAQSVDDVLPPADQIGEALHAGLGAVSVVTTGSAGARRLRLVGWVLGGLAVVSGVLALLLGFDVVAMDGLWTATAAGGVLAVLAVGAFLLSARRRTTLAERRAAQTRASALAVLRSVIQTALATPTQTVLDKHRDVRQSALSVRDRPSTGALADAEPTAS